MFPKLFGVDGFFLPTYGLLVAAGFLAALWLTGRLARQSGLNPDKVTNLGVYVALAGLLGAKLFMFVIDFDYYRKNPSEVFTMATLQAGGVFYGGLLLALAAGYWLMRRDQLPPATTLDCFAPGLALGQALGRLGCFAAGCCWGTECDRSWAVTFRNPEANRLTGVPLMVPLHPTQIYEAVLYFGVFGVVYWRFRKSHSPGVVMGWYLVLAASARFGVEFLRFHQQALPFGGPLSTAQWTALGLIGLGIFLLARRSSLPSQ